MKRSRKSEYEQMKGKTNIARRCRREIRQHERGRIKTKR
jgi:hypothetical protein